MSEKPMILLVFANDQAGRRYLRDLPEEQRRLRAIVQEAVDRGLCVLEIRTNVTLDEIAEVFTRHGRRVAIFHYAGHAGPEGLLLESPSGEARLAHAAACCVVACCALVSAQIRFDQAMIDLASPDPATRLRTARMLTDAAYPEAALPLARAVGPL